MNTKTYVKEIDGKWYAFALNEERAQVYSIGKDSYDGSRFAGRTDSGIKYVASSSPTKRAAIEKAKRAGAYCGICK